MNDNTYMVFVHTNLKSSSFLKKRLSLFVCLKTVFFFFVYHKVLISVNDSELRQQPSSQGSKHRWDEEQHHSYGRSSSQKKQKHSWI